MMSPADALPQAAPTSVRSKILAASAWTLKDNKLYAGEVVFFGAVAKATKVRLGSLADSSSLTGDRSEVSDALGSAPGFTDVKTPILDGVPVRLSGGQSLKQRAFAAAGLDATTVSTSSFGTGSIALNDAQQHVLHFHPVGDVLIDSSVADGFSNMPDGRLRFTVSGLQVFYAPALDKPGQLLTQEKVKHASSSATIRTDGSYRLVQLGDLAAGGTESVLRPAWLSIPDSRTGLLADGNGQLLVGDGKGATPLLPAAADVDAVLQAALAIDPSASVQTDLNSGTLVVTLQGIAYRLLPNAALQTVPAESAGQAWWVDSQGRAVFRNGDGSAQAFQVQ